MLKTGWDDYADGWRVEAPDGTILGNRELLHPHANEQPFTRSLSGVVIPADLEEIQIRTRTNTHRAGGRDNCANCSLTPLQGIYRVVWHPRPKDGSCRSH